MKIRSQTSLTPLSLVLFLLFSVFIPVLSQHPALFFKHLSVEDGLSQSTVHAIYKDKMGFMWFATDIGLNKYDGIGFTVYQHSAIDTNSISSNYIQDILEDSYGSFWIGSGNSGLNLFDRQHERFIKYVYEPHKEGSLSNNNIRSIFEDSRRNLWIGTAGGGLNLYDRRTDSFVHFRHDSLNPSGLGSNYISSIVEDKTGNLWLGSPEGILTKFNIDTKTGQSYKIFDPYKSYLNNISFYQVYIDSDEQVWFGSEYGVYVIDQKSAAIQHFKKGSSNKDLNVDAVSTITEMEKGILLIATDQGGINIYNKKSGTFTYVLHSRFIESSISNNQVLCIYKSSDGIIWTGNYHGGINIFDEKAVKFQQYQNLVDESEFFNCQNSVLAMCEDKTGNIWIGTDGQGIDIIDPDNYKITRLKSEKGGTNALLSNVVKVIYRDKQDDLFIGTFLEGMSILDWKTKRLSHYKHNANNAGSIGGNNIWTICEDRDGFYWIGTLGNGLDRFDRKTGKFRHFQHDPDDTSSLCNNDVFKVIEDNAGRIWVGTRNGLCMLNKDGATFTRFRSAKFSKNGIYGNWIYDMHQDEKGNLWIGTEQALNLYNPVSKGFVHFGEQEGLNGNAVFSIINDHNNHLWISTNKGLSRFDVAYKKFRNFDETDGLQNSEFNYVSVLRGSDNKLYFGGRNGFNVFHPDSIYDNTNVPPVYFTRLLVMNTPIGPRHHSGILRKHINYEKSVTLTSKQTNVTFEFAALNYSNPQKNQYAYWLEGFDDNWNDIGNKHEVSYAGLNPGKYTLWIKGSNNDAVWNETGTSLQIVILPPWWKTWWFRALMIIFIGGFLLMIYVLRLNFYRNQQRKLLVLVKERTAQLENIAVTLQQKQAEINEQNEELKAQKDALEKSNQLLVEQKLQILEQNRALDNHRDQLETLVDERTRELVEARDKAEESDRLKSSFLSNLSHEIRTPLNAILGFSSLLGEKDVSSRKREEYNSIIQSSSNTLLELISDILDISKIEAGQLKLDLKVVLLENVINDMVGIFDLLIKRKDIGSEKPVKLKVNIEEEILKTLIITDKLRIEQILSNLISNAIKFTSEGYIEIGCSRAVHAEMLEFYVKDTGIGIKAENQKLIFERFRKVEEDSSNLQRGTGLGLAITSQLVGLLGGSIWLTSEVGKGSVFYFTIPFIKSDSTYVPIRENKQVTPLLPDFKNSIILVAEDDITNFNYIRRLLKMAKANVIHAVTGRQVLKILEKNHDIKLILMDIKMPEMDGIETLHEIRRLKIDIPVIAQTAYALAEEVTRLKNEGFDEYISKPIQREYLYSVIAAYL